MQSAPSRTQKDDAKDDKVLATLRIISRLKESQTNYQEFVKAATRYQQQMIALSTAGKALTDVMMKMSEERGGELGDAIRKIADAQKQVDAKRTKLAQAVADQLVQPYEKSGQGQLELDKSEVINFEKSYKSKKSASLRTIKKWERESNKLNKKKNKDTAKVHSALTSLTESVEQHDQLLGEQLRAVSLIDRKKYCFFIGQWNKVMDEEVDGMESGLKALQEHQGELDAIAKDSEKISNETQDLILTSRPERALSQLKNARETGYFTTLDLSEVEEGGSEDGSTIRGNKVQKYKVRVRQRYDAQQPDELSLTVGEIFDVGEEVDENWGIADLNGRRGIFPLNHVEKMISLKN